MTRTVTAPDLGGTGSVLAIWSILVVIIGTSLFVYGVIVTVRGRRSRRHKRRSRPAGPTRPRGVPSHQPSREVALPSGPTAGRPGPSRALAPQRGSLALPAGSAPRRIPMAPPPARIVPPRPAPLPLASTPATPPPAWPPVAPNLYPSPMLPAASAPPNQIAGPTAGTYSSAEAPHSSGPVYAGHRAPVSSPPQGYPGHDNYPGHDSYPGQEGYPGQPRSEHTADAPTALHPSTQSPGRPYSGATDAATALHSAVAGTSPTFGIDSSTVRVDGPTVRVPPPKSEQASEKQGKRAKHDGCAQLRAECEELARIANDVAARAAEAAAEAESALADYRSAQRNSAEARLAHERVAHEAGDVATKLASLERDTSATQQDVERETTHAAFAAYRRGDITSEQLREVFRRAEGWTPEHDRLSRRATELRAEETDAARLRDSAILAEDVASERVRDAALAAQALDERARTAALDARARCAAAEACEERTRRR